MLETSLRRLEPSEQITSKLDQIIEAFVSFYGEERRDEITNRLINTQIIKFSSISTLKENVRKVKESILKELYDIPEDKYLGFGVEKLIKFLLEKDKFSFDYMDEEVKKIVFQNSDISAQEAFTKFENGEYQKLNELLKIYESIKPMLDSYEKIIDEYEIKSSEIRKKYYNILIDKFKYLIPSEEIEYYNKYNFPDKIMRAYFDMSIIDNGHPFDDNHERIINDSNAPGYKRDSIISDRLRFLKVFGYEYASYDECLKDQKCIDFIKNIRSKCQEISEEKTKLYRLQVVELVESTEDYQKCRQSINEKNYVNKNDSLGPFVYESIGVSCCEANYRIKDGEMILSPLVLINAGASDFDCTIIHELNHAFEYYTVEFDNRHCSNYSGWDYDSFEIRDHQEHEQLIYKGISRRYELLSEYINDRIAQEITDIMHNQGNYILDNKHSNNTSSYMTVRFLAEKFYKEFKDVIIRSRSNGNIDYLLDMVGKENFEALNDLINEYYDKFGFGTSGQLAIVDYYHNKPNEHSEEIKDLIARRDLIINRMLEYQQNSKESNQITR